MRKFLLLIMCLSLIPIAGTAFADCYFATLSDSNSNDFFYSRMYERDRSTYDVARAKDEWIRYVADGHDFYCGGCYSAGIIRNFTCSQNNDYLEELIRIYKAKGYKVHDMYWSD